MDQRLEIFTQYRPLLFAIAYRMLGTVADAEDMVQESWLRWQTAKSAAKSPKAYLSKLITRLCIDHLRSARVQREMYIGPWLPEPLVTDLSSNPPADQAVLSDSLSFAFLRLLECLSPIERAVFLLREVFDYDYIDIAKIVNKSPPNCRQILCRARRRLPLSSALAPLKTGLTPEQQQELVECFLRSWNQGDVMGLIVLMAEDAIFWADGGGKAVAARKPLQGHLKIARFLIAIQRSQRLPRFTPKIAWVNGQPGIVNLDKGYPQSVFSIEWTGRGLQSIFAVVNPDKLRAVRLHR
jgi:RNA polymerase sigma-70 factor (ECF subfamily)